jgi:hypothetical protein
VSQKNIAAILLAVAAVLGGPPAVRHAIDVQEEVVANIEVSGAEVAEVGELVELSITGQRPSWLVPVQDHRVLGNTVLVSFRDPGVYEIIASAIGSGRSTLVRHIITVGTPEPEVIDEPTPDPVPTPTPEPEVTKPSLSHIVAKWCDDSNAPDAACKQLGDNFIDAATNANNIDDLLTRLAKANRKVNQKGCERVLAQIQQYLFDNLAGQDLEAHRCAFDEIGTGLLNYSKPSTGGWRS